MTSPKLFTHGVNVAMAKALGVKDVSNVRKVTLVIEAGRLPRVTVGMDFEDDGELTAISETYVLLVGAIEESF
jgi:hypothetical protein